MNLGSFVSSQTGLIHLIASIIALMLGTVVLWMKKGTAKHKLTGKFYAFSMLIVLITAYMIYHLFGTWGIFHWAAVLGSLTLLCGLIPIFLKRPIKNFVSLHFTFMYWSIMGLYGAFVSEILVRIPKVILDSGVPNRVFYAMTGLGTALIMGIGLHYFIRLNPKWREQFGHSTNDRVSD